MKKNFVKFYSPGTFVAEVSTKDIKTWDVDLAVTMSKEIKERHGATPYAFSFLTRERGVGDLDSRVSQQSGMYYLGGEVLSLEQIEARKNPDDSILIQNMKGNDWDKVVENTNSWKVVQPLRDGDVVLEHNPTP